MRISVAGLFVVAANNAATIGVNGFVPPLSSLPSVSTIQQKEHASFVPSLASTSTTSLGASRKPLASDGDWSAYLDSENTGVVYYFNGKTGESLWEPPEGFPTVSLSDALQTIAAEKQAAYNEKKRLEEEEERKKNGLFGLLFAKSDDETEGDDNEVGASSIESGTDADPTKDGAEDETPWYDGLFDKKEKEEDQPVVATTTIAPDTNDGAGGGGKGLFSSIFGTTTDQVTQSDSLPLETSASIQQEDEEEEEQAGQDSPAFGFGNLFGASKAKDSAAAAASESAVAVEEPEPVETTSPKKTGFSVGGFFGSSSGAASTPASTATKSNKKNVDVVATTVNLSSIPVAADDDDDNDSDGDGGKKKKTNAFSVGGLFSGSKPKKPASSSTDKASGVATTANLDSIPMAKEDVKERKKPSKPSPTPVKAAKTTAAEKKETKKPPVKTQTMTKATSAAAATTKKEPKKAKATATTPVEPKTKGTTTPAVAGDVDTIVDIDISYVVTPHPEKVSWGGEDAVFTSGRNFGVFDGVSGATKEKGKPLYSKTLAMQMKKSVGQSPSTVNDLTSRLTEAAELANDSATGASTAIVGSVSDEGMLRVLNLGDSSCFVLRDGKVAAKSREISHGFDTPYQLSNDSPDRPRQGTRLETKLQSGDVIVMGSDGIFDNLSEALLVETVADAPARAGSIAKKVADLSRKVSLDKKAETPYAKQAQRAGDNKYSDGLGGKIDDISCVVVRCK